MLKEKNEEGRFVVQKKRVDMLYGSITKSMLQMILPLMVINIISSLFKLIDMSILGKLTNDNAVGAVGVCNAIISLCTGTLIGISAGANVLVARCIGEENQEKTEKAVGTAIMVSLILGILVLVFGVSFAEVFLRWIDCPESIFDKAAVYFRIYFIGMPAISLYNFAAAILRAFGDTKRPMVFLIIGAVIKIVLDIVLITAFNMTAEGVAIATASANIVAAGLTLGVLFSEKDKIHISLKILKIRSEEVKQILFIGVPAGLHFAFSAFSNVVMSSAVNGLGVNAVTGVSVANRFDEILYQISNAPSLASMAFVAQNIGAKNFKRAEKAVLIAVIITVIVGLFPGILFALFSKQLSGLITNTPAVIEYSCQRLILVSLTYFLCGINDVFGEALRGMGKPIAPTVATFLFLCLLRFVWVYGFFPRFLHLTFLYLVWPVGWAGSITTLFIIYFYSMKNIRKG